MGELVAVDGCVVEVKSPEVGSVTITSVPSTKMFQNIGTDLVPIWKAVYEGPVMNVTVAGASNTSGCQGATGAGVINASAQKTLYNEIPVMREGDQGTILVNGTIPGSPPQACSFSVTVEITSAGQTKASGD